MDLAPLRKLIVPAGLLAAGLLVRGPAAELPAVYAKLLVWLPYASLGASLVLCIFFNSSRLFTAALAMLAVYMTIQHTLQTSLTESPALLIYTALGLALPLTLLLLMYVPERGLNNRHGLMLVAVVPGLALCIITLLYMFPATAPDGFINQYLRIRPAAGIVLSLPAILGHVLVLLAALFRLLQRNEDSVAALAGTLLFGLITLMLFDQPRISAVLFSISGLALIVSMLTHSYNMAFRDELTGLLGRRALNERMKGLGRQYAIAMVDVDHFKKFNDTWGHDTGDDVLKMVGKRIDAVEGGGIAYRYGGEEFCILFPGRTAEQSIPFLEVVRKSVENHRMIVRNLKQRPKSAETALQRRGRRAAGRGEKSVAVTISIGVAEPGPRHTKPAEVLKAADSALYIAKQDGRNCIRMPEE